MNWHNAPNSVPNTFSFPIEICEILSTPFGFEIRDVSGDGTVLLRAFGRLPMFDRVIQHGIHSLAIRILTLRVIRTKLMLVCNYSSRVAYLLSKFVVCILTNANRARCRVLITNTTDTTSPSTAFSWGWHQPFLSRVPLPVASAVVGP
jgi:hypothetical protein